MKKINNVAGLVLLMLLTGQVLLIHQTHAQIELPWLLSEGAILQRDEPIPIWGTAPADSDLRVVFAGEERQIQSNRDGKWRTVFSPRKAGGPYQLTVSGGGFSRTVDAILMGDVWVCSGQSNMEWMVRNSDGATTEITSTNQPQIRHFKVPRSWAAEPAEALAGGNWQLATQENLGDFTGVGWYFAKRIHASTEVPIGLINTTWGGSRIEAWMSPKALGTSPTAAQEKLAAMAANGEMRASRVKDILSRWPGALANNLEGGDADWSAAQLDESDWLKIRVPGLWESQQFPGVDGILWYRKTFDLTKAQAATGITLGLGRIDDNDIAWVNGHKIGATNAYDRVRAYSVPAKYLKSGGNQIAVRVEDSGGGGGIYGSADLVYFAMADGTQRSLAGEWKIKADKATVVIQDNMHHTDTALYNKMLHPLFNIPVKGVLWYQGEANANTLQEAQIYRQQFAAFIHDIRARWNTPSLPIYWVQLANFISGNDTQNASPWAVLRESQTAALALKNTGQAITIDIGNPGDIHPTDKKTVGERLALIALNKTYGQKKLEFRGPVYEAAKQRKKQLVLSFRSAGKLGTRDKSASVKGFEIAGENGQFRPVDGVIRKNRVILPLPDSTNVAAVRYAWSDNPDIANLVDGAGLPAEPFRVDLLQPVQRYGQPG